MNKKITIITAAALFLVVGLWFWAQKSQKTTQGQPIDRDAQLVLFYGRECPHCKELEKFIMDNGIIEKIKFENLEVYHDKNNSGFLIEKAKECGIDEKDLVVPFFYARGKCLTGVPNIEEFLKKEAGL